MSERGLVLVTGGSGYIAGFCISQLLKEGWRVRTTLRSLSRQAEVRASISRIANIENLEFVAANLESDTGWAEALAGCQYVMHVASPLPSHTSSDDNILVRPARDGALRVLAAAQQAGIKRVVMTASTAAIAYGHGGRSKPFDESDWSDETNRADTSAYERSKTIAERAAWKWLSDQAPGGVELVTINPGAVLGPILGRDYSASIDIVKKLLDGSVPGLPRFGWPLVDVRDIADLHYRAMINPTAASQRFIGAGPFFWMADIARVLRTQMPSLAGKVPTRTLPDFLLRGLAWFDPVIRERLFELGKERPVVADKAKAMLGWAPRSNEESIIATAESLLAEGIIQAK
jgi:dihydroflavonol-4-reductase